MAYRIKQNPGYNMPIFQQSCNPAAGAATGARPNPGHRENIQEDRLNPDVPGQLKAMNEPASREQFPVGMAYVPWQELNELYDLERGFRAGTIFPDLDLPFTGRCKK